MRLLLFTQTVDQKDPALGFFHGWIEELALHFEHSTVCALNIGEQSLPPNVTLVPLRPWGYRARLRTAARTLALAWRYRHDYDVVLVHMNQEYVLVAGWLWKLLGKRVYLWRNHYAGTLWTDIAALFCDKVFYTSKSSYTAKYAHARQMPVGVNVGSCHLDEPIAQKARSVLFLGRFDRSKRPDLVIEALGLLSKEGVGFVATFVGGPSDPNSSLPAEVAARAKELGIADRVTFAGPVPNTDTYRYYRSHLIYVNCGKSGMLDKSLFKAIACGCLPLFVSADLAEIVGSDFAYREGDTEDLARHMKKLLLLSEAERAAAVRRLQEQAIDAHTLPVLAKRLVEEMNV